MPIPLVKSGDQWHFDTAAGKEEIINRHIGKDELAAIAVCRAFANAEHERFAAGTGYTSKMKSSPGAKDGLYWQAGGKDETCKFGPTVAEALANSADTSGKGRQSFHGYYFKVLTRQGKDAPGGRKDYMVNGQLSEGVALIAYPEHWDQSGIMTFMVNQEGQVYQRNLGPKSLHLARSIKEYNPDNEWTQAQDEGLAGAVAE
jgi:hypothetical protein